MAELSAVPFSALPQTSDGYTVLYENNQVCRSEKKLSELVGDKTSSFLTKEQGDSLYQEKGNYLVADDITGKLDKSQYAVDSATFLTAHQDISNKLDTTAFSTVSGNFLTAHQNLDEYATQEWVNDQGFLKEHQPISADEWNDVYETVVSNSGTWETETDWTDDINDASAYAYEQAVAQIPAPFDPTFLSGEIDKKLDKTFSSNFYPMNENPSGYLTEHQSLEGYLTKSSGDEYYQPKGNYVTDNTFNTTTNYLSGAVDYVSANAKDVLYVKIIPGPGAGTLDTNYATINEAINNGKIVVVQDYDSNKYYYYSTRLGNSNIYFTTTYTKDAANTLTVNEIYIKNTQETQPTVYRDLSKTYDFNNYATSSQLETVSSNITSMIPSTEGLASETLVESVSGEIVDKIPDVFIITNDIEQRDIPISEDLSYFYKDKYGNLYPLVDKYDVTDTTASKYTTYVFRGITDDNLIKEYHAYVVSSKIDLVEDCVYEYNKTVYGGNANYIPFSFIVEADRAVGANYPTVNSSVSSSGINVKFIWPNDPSLTAEGWPETPTGNLQLNDSEYEWSNSGNMYYIDHYIQGIETIKNQNILLTISSEYGELVTTGGPYVDREQWGYFNCVDVTANPDFYIEYQNTNFNILTGTNNIRFYSIQSLTGDADIQNIYSGTVPEKSDYLFRNNYYFVLPDMSYSDMSKPLHFKCINYFKQDTGDVLTDGDNLVGLKIGNTNYQIPQGTFTYRTVGE